MRFEIYQDAAGEWRWRLVAVNGEPIAASEGYTREADVERAIETVKRGVPTALIERNQGGHREP